MTMQRTPIIGGNWKMNTDAATGSALARSITGGLATMGIPCEIVIFPPAPYLSLVGDVLEGSGIALGAQDVWMEPDGPCTGDISTTMLTDCAVTWVLCGHSERRHGRGESDAMVNAKLRSVLDDGLCGILCLGETLEERQDNRTSNVVLKQLRDGLSGIPADAMGTVVIAYEPVWAIGTGETATAPDAQKVHAEIRRALGDLYDASLASSIRIQYGGSVTPTHASAMMGQEDIDGFLVGGASLVADNFLAIINSVHEETSSSSSREGSTT